MTVFRVLALDAQGFYYQEEWVKDTESSSESGFSLRGNIGIVHQEAFLFTLTIHDNIAFGNSSATRDEVIAAANEHDIAMVFTGMRHFRH